MPLNVDLVEEMDAKNWDVELSQTSVSALGIGMSSEIEITVKTNDDTEAGVHGGEVVAEGNLKKILKNKLSLTAQYLNKKKKIDVPKKRRIFNKNKVFTLQKIKTNNLNNLEVKFPLGNFIK